MLRDVGLGDFRSNLQSASDFCLTVLRLPAYLAGAMREPCSLLDLPQRSHVKQSKQTWFSQDVRAHSDSKTHHNLHRLSALSHSKTNHWLRQGGIFPPVQTAKENLEKPTKPTEFRMSRVLPGLKIRRFPRVTKVVAGGVQKSLAYQRYFPMPKQTKQLGVIKVLGTLLFPNPPKTLLKSRLVHTAEKALQDLQTADVCRQ